jgi:hypothetical protein
VLQAAIQAQIHTYSLLVIFPLLFLLGDKKGEIITFVGAILLAGTNTLANHQFFKVSWPQAFFKGFLISISTNLVQVLLVLLFMMAITKW